MVNRSESFSISFWEAGVRQITKHHSSILGDSSRNATGMWYVFKETNKIDIRRDVATVTDNLMWTTELSSQQILEDICSTVTSVLSSLARKRSSIRSTVKVVDAVSQWTVCQRNVFRHSNLRRWTAKAKFSAYKEFSFGLSPLIVHL